jgi:hypothetical protein
MYGCSWNKPGQFLCVKNWYYFAHDDVLVITHFSFTQSVKPFISRRYGSTLARDVPFAGLMVSGKSAYAFIVVLVILVNLFATWKKR